jgi:hemerythrin-like domain-containing protein
MDYSEPLQALIEEHRLLEMVLGALSLEMQDIQRQPFPTDSFKQAVDFLTNFSDHWHLIKEEERLFPLLWERGVPLENGPLGKMMAEHETSRRQLARVRTHFTALQQGDPDALPLLVSEVSAYIRLMTQHMRKEEQSVYNVARTLLNRKDNERLAREFEEVEQEQIAHAFHEWQGA